MHEMGLTDALLKMVDKIVAEEDVSGVNKITLEIGNLSGVVPRFLKECWDAVAYGTAYQSTELVIKTVNGVARCEDCKREFEADIDDLRCPYCRGFKLTPLTGRDMTILEIEAY